MTDGGTTYGGWMSVPFYGRVTIISLVIYAVALMVLGMLLAVQGTVASLAFVAPFAIVSLVLAVLAWRLGMRMALTLGIWAVLNLLFHGPFLVPALGRFNSFFDFGTVIPVIAALAVTAVAGVVAFVQQRKDAARAEGTAGERRMLSGVAVIVVLLMAASGIANLAGLESVSAEERAGAIKVDMKNTEFDPAEIRIAAGQPARLVIKNRDLATHTFTVDTLGIDVSFIPGTEKIVDLSVLNAGTYVYICAIEGHEEMKGTIVVR
jgi:plastocyanin